MTVPGRHLVLTGPMASGKTTLGRILARRLGRRFVDSDEQIMSRLGRTGREVAAEHGVDMLHEHEARAVLEALDDEEPAVIAALTRRRHESLVGLMPAIRIDTSTQTSEESAETILRALQEDDPAR